MRQEEFEYLVDKVVDLSASIKTKEQEINRLLQQERRLTMQLQKAENDITDFKAQLAQALAGKVGP